MPSYPSLLIGKSAHREISTLVVQGVQGERSRVGVAAMIKNFLGTCRHTGSAKSLFASFSDYAPNTWGRMPIRRHAERDVQKESRTQHRLREEGYLLGGSDFAHQSVLRCKRELFGSFLQRQCALHRIRKKMGSESTLILPSGGFYCKLGVAVRLI